VNARPLLPTVSLEISDMEGEPSRPPSVTVLIPAHNEAEYIERCVASCWNQTHPPEQVVVIADACTDETSVLARRTGAVVMEINEQSKPRGLNLALARVDTDLVFLLDADSYLANDAVEQCLHAMSRWGFGGVCTKVRQQPDMTRGLFPRARAIEWSATHAWSRRMETAIGWLSVLSGMAGCYRVEALRAVGGWSDDGLCEDVELAMKFNAAGYRPGFAPKAYVYVRDPTSLKVYHAQIKRWAAGWAQAIAKHKRLFFTRPRFLLVFGVMLLDSALLMLALVILARVISNGPSTADIGGWAGWTYLAMSSWTIALASAEIGVRRTLRSWPCFAVVSMLTSAVSLWTMLREWGLGRHLSSWTGRQGRRSVMTPMPAGRRRVFAGTSLTMAFYAVVGLGTAATVLEPTGIIPDLPLPEAVERVIGGDEPPPSASAPSTSAPERRIQASVDTPSGRAVPEQAGGAPFRPTAQAAPVPAGAADPPSTPANSQPVTPPPTTAVASAAPTEPTSPAKQKSSTEVPSTSEQPEETEAPPTSASPTAEPEAEPARPETNTAMPPGPE